MAKRVYGTLVPGVVKTETVSKPVKGTDTHPIEDAIGEVLISVWGGTHPGWLTAPIYITVDGATDPVVGENDMLSVLHPSQDVALPIPSHRQSVEIRMITELHHVQYSLEAR